MIHRKIHGGVQECKKLTNNQCDRGENCWWTHTMNQQDFQKEISVVFNYSKIKLSQAMETLLNRGFNFSILPLKLDLTQVLVDLRDLNDL